MSSSPTSSSSSNKSEHPLASMFDLGIAVDVLVGTTSISVQECLKLHRQSVVRLTQSSGSDLTLRVSGVAVASGEVVIVDESTAVRISEIAQPPGAEPEL